MATYLLFIRDRIRDEGPMAEYSKMAQASLAGHQFEPLILYGAAETLEGAEVEGVVLFKFADKAAAMAWYNGPEYTEARKIRNLNSDYRVAVLEGI
jgi:uncharacterized protein (DUF1330 family)